MSGITKSLSEALRQIKNKMPVDTELFDFTDHDIGCAISVTKIKSSNKTGDTFKVGVNILCECRVSLALDNVNSKAIELAALVFAEVEDNTFDCSAMTPTNIVALPDGNSEKHCHWFVNWDQEFYVERIDLSAT